MAKPRIKLPKTVKAGETIEVKTLIRHKMESGHRKDEQGKTIPRSIINRFVVDFNGENVLDVALNPSVSANPYFKFEVTIPESGELNFTWHDDNGSKYESKKKITVS